jgi:Ran GTPase-activating protein (RanGAP) involved in mRNA processing and transport
LPISIHKKILGNLVFNNTFSLKYLNLENNHLGDEIIQFLITSLMENRFLTSLNLSRNNIADSPMEHFSKLLRKSSSLLELYLHFNHITTKGGAIFFKGLQKN